MERKKIFKKASLIFLLLFLITSEMSANAALAGAVASSAAAARRREEARQEQHASQYHNGPLTYYIEDYELWSWKKPYIISEYKRKYYYYQIDPDQCVQYTEDVFMGKRFASEAETQEHDFHLKIMGIIIAVLVTILLVMIVVWGIIPAIKNKRNN